MAGADNIHNPVNDVNEEGSSLKDALDKYNGERDHYKMIEGEFTADKDKVDELTEKAKNDIFELLPDARDMLEALMRGAESEAIRWSATKFVLEFGLKGGEADDGLARLFKSLSKDKKLKPPKLPSEVE